MDFAVPVLGAVVGDAFRDCDGGDCKEGRIMQRTEDIGRRCGSGASVSAMFRCRNASGRN